MQLVTSALFRTVRHSHLFSLVIHTLETCERERRVAVGFDLGVDVGAAVQQQPHGRRVPVHGGQHQWRDAELRPRP